MNKNIHAPSIGDLMTASHNGGSHDHLSVRPLNLQTEIGYDSYNPTGSFDYNGRLLLAARVERHDEVLRANTQFFQRDAQTNVWYHDESLPTLPLEDPFVVHIEDNWLVGGVKVYTKPANNKELDYFETQIYGGRNLEDLRHIFTGPKGMKDIRLVSTEGGLGIFTRPQDKQKGGRGRIGFTAISRLSELTPQLVYDAPLLGGVIAHEQGQWGGVNEAYPLPDGRIGVLAHLAKFVTMNGVELDDREYSAITFTFDHNRNLVTNQQVIACRDCFPADLEPKRPDLEKVVFPGGLILDGNTAVVNVGVGDSSSWQKTLDHHPFH